MVRYNLPIGSLDLVERMRAEHDCLLVPGDHFRVPSSLRIGFGPDPRILEQGLDRLGMLIDELRA